MIGFKVDNNTEELASKLGPEIEAAASRAVQKLAYSALAQAQMSIQKGPKSGRIYVRGKIRHQASAPGEPPATDRGRLVSSGHVETPEKFRADMVFGAEYAPYLEYGTRNMAARPFMRPAGDAQKPKAGGVFVAEFTKVWKAWGGV